MRTSVMKRLTALGLPIATVAVAFFFAASFRTEAATITWTNTSGGNWSVATNWNPNQVPTNTDVVFITTPGTYTVKLDITTDYRFFYPTVTLGAGGGAAGAQTLAMTNVNFYFTNLLVTTGGVFTASGTDVGLPGQTLTVNGGVLNSVSSSFGNTLILTNGGVATSTNSGYEIVTVANGVFNSAADTFSISGFLGDVSALTVANGGILNEFKIAILDSSLTVAAGGVVNGVDYSAAVGILTGAINNYGTINITNTGFLIGYGTYPTLLGGIVNQPGGVIHLSGTVSLASTGGYGVIDSTYFTNKGSLTQTDGVGSTIGVGSFENSEGTDFLCW